MAIEFFAELSTEGAAACTSSEPAEDGTRYCAEGDANWASNSADSSPYLARSQSSACAASGSADGANRCANLHSRL